MIRHIQAAVESPGQALRKSLFETPESRCYDKCRSGTIFLSKHASISDDIHNTNKKDGEEKMLFDDMVLDLETCRDDNIDFDEPVVLEK